MEIMNENCWIFGREKKRDAHLGDNDPEKGVFGERVG